MTATQRMVATACSVTCLLLGGSAPIHGDNLGSYVNFQLAMARAATAQYHDTDVALAAGYVQLPPNPFEDNAVEFVNFPLVDCTLDVRQPEALSYTVSGGGLRLTGVEYSIPMECAATPPDDFLPGTGEWEQEHGVPVWTLRIPLWSGNSGESH